jgi:hypothetical protein
VFSPEDCRPGKAVENSTAAFLFDSFPLRAIQQFVLSVGAAILGAVGCCGEPGFWRGQLAGRRKKGQKGARETASLPDAVSTAIRDF